MNNHLGEAAIANGL